MCAINYGIETNQENVLKRFWWLAGLSRFAMFVIKMEGNPVVLNDHLFVLLGILVTVKCSDKTLKWAYTLEVYSY